MFDDDAGRLIVPVPQRQRGAGAAVGFGLASVIGPPLSDARRSPAPSGPVLRALGRRSAISFRGIGGARWGAKLERVEDVLGVSFDCSEGLVPGKCLCPPSQPDLSIGFVFDLMVPRLARLQSLSAYGGSAHTTRGISIGSTKGAVERSYPGARYEVNAPLDAGLSTYLLARHRGHALVFVLDAGRVRGIGAYARGGSGYLAAEKCA